MGSKGFKVLIAGGSISGLTLACMLERLGIDFVILEAYPEIAPQVGASIGFFPNGCRILDQIGCYDDVRAKLDGGLTDMLVKSPEAVTLGPFERAGEHFIARYGYEPVFVDRQMAIEVFYDHLKDKSKVLVDKRVVSVKPLATGVEVTTKDGSTYTGDILVGADGVYSTVRKEMWRLGEQLAPGYFPKSDWTDVPCDYLCMFGISNPIPGFTKSAWHSITGHNRSFLVMDGPGGRIYWFLFIKNERTLHGMENEIPRRFTKEEEKAFAEKYSNQPISGNFTFGDLYKNHFSAILTALPEFVFTKWHFGRIITIGDAVHKFNPISGQGGNNAIETAATLATEIFNMLKKLPEKASPSNADISAAFQRTQELRRERVSQMVEAGHKQQSLMALETPFLEFIATKVMPLAGKEGTLEIFSDLMLPARRLPMLPMPKRPRFEPYQDELPAKPLGRNKISMGIAATIFAVLFVVARKAMRFGVDIFGMNTTFHGAPLVTIYTGITPVDETLRLILPTFSDSIAGTDLSHPLQFAYLLSILFPVLLIWTVEAYRNGNAFTVISLPFIFGVAYQLEGIGNIAPLYFLLSVWTTWRPAYTRAIGRPVPVSVAKSVLPAVSLGYAVPTILMFLPYGNAYTKQSLIAFWQGVPIWVAVLTYAGKRLLELCNPPDAFDMYKKEDVKPLRDAYMVSFWLSAIVYVAFVANIALSSLPTVAFANIFGNLPNPLSAWSVPTREEHIFIFLRYDFAFSSLAVALWCLYSVYELRRNGWAMTKETVLAAAAVVVGEVLVGPGAVYSGLWWWREGIWARDANLQGRLDE